MIFMIEIIMTMRMMIMLQWRWVLCSLSAICFGFYVFSHRAICCAAEMCQFHRKVFRGFQVEVCWVLNMQPHNIFGFITENVLIVLLSLIISTIIHHHYHHQHHHHHHLFPHPQSYLQETVTVRLWKDLWCQYHDYLLVCTTYSRYWMRWLDGWMAG